QSLHHGTDLGYSAVYDHLAVFWGQGLADALDDLADALVRDAVLGGQLHQCLALEGVAVPDGLVPLGQTTVVVARHGPSSERYSRECSVQRLPRTSGFLPPNDPYTPMIPPYGPH